MKRKLVIVWLWLGIVMIFFMVVIGGVTRLTHSGLSIVEWDLISEAPLFPSEQEATELFNKYKQFPEYKLLNQDYTLDDFKFILFWENLHRKWGRLIGLVFIVPYLLFTWRGAFNIQMHKRLLVIFALGVFQGFLGYFMVASGLVDEPAVSHYRLAAHLIVAFITCAYIYWVLMCYIGENRTQGRLVKTSLIPVLKLRRYFAIALLFTIFQIILGGFVAGLKAGVYYNTFPKMGIQWIPQEVFSGLIIDTVQGVQFLHRYMAYVVVLIIGYILYYFLKKRQSFSLEQSRNLYITIAIVLFQFLLGVFTLLYSVPLSIALLHQLGAFLLLLVIVRNLFFLTYKTD